MSERSRTTREAPDGRALQPARRILPLRDRAMARRESAWGVRDREGARRARGRACALRGAPRLGASDGARGLDRGRLAEGGRRPRAAALAADDLPRGIRPRRWSGPGRAYRRGPARADGDPFRECGSEGALPAADPLRRRGLVPGLLRTGRRLGSRERADAGRARRRRMGRQRAEGLDLGRGVVRLVLRRLPDRSAGAAQHRGISYLLVGWISRASKCGRSSR